MTEIEKQALALLNEVRAERGDSPRTECSRNWNGLAETLCRAIERHEAFRREVSDAVEAFNKRWASAKLRSEDWEVLLRFIIAKPDPLADAVQEVWHYANGCEHMAPARAAELHKALAARGLKIVEADNAS